MLDTRHIHVTYDPDAGVWWAESDDLTGLVSEAPTLEALVERVTAVAGELLAANGTPAGRVSLEFVATRQVRIAGTAYYDQREASLDSMSASVEHGRAEGS